MAIEKIQSDTPTEATTSSVGSIVWPPVEAGEQRKKGILHRVLETSSDIKQIITEFSQLPFGQNKENEEITRISGRIFVSNTGLRDIIAKQEEGVSCIEAVVPLIGSEVDMLNDCSMVYLGKNAESRKTTPEQIDRELHAADEIFHSPLPPNPHTYKDFSFVTLDNRMKNDPAIQRQYDQLYSAFGWTSEDVAKILTSSNNMLLAAFKNDELVSAGMAERVHLKLERKGEDVSLVMYEITEAATKEEYRGNGLYTQVAYKLMEELAGTDVNLAYAESNLLAPGVLKSASRQGRQNTISTALSFGLYPKVLEQHVRIFGGSTDVRPENEKNDLLVTFIPRNDILNRYGKNN